MTARPCRPALRVKPYQAAPCSSFARDPCLFSVASMACIVWTACTIWAACIGSIDCKHCLSLSMSIEPLSPSDGLCEGRGSKRPYCPFEVPPSWTKYSQARCVCWATCDIVSNQSRQISASIMPRRRLDLRVSELDRWGCPLSESMKHSPLQTTTSATCPSQRVSFQRSHCKDCTIPNICPRLAAA